MKLVAKPVDAIVVFKGSGRPLPYKFKYTDRTGASREVCVGKIICINESKIGAAKSYIYECQSTMEGLIRRYQLKYFIAECKWELYKI